VLERFLKKIREKVHSRSFVVTIHADEEMNEDGLTVFDLERVLLTGTIVEQQKDRETGECKYLVKGQTIDNGKAVVVVKLSPTEKLVIITVFVVQDRREHRMVCDNCGKLGARIRRITRSYGKGKNLLVIENVPVVSCPECGENYLTAEALYEIERIKLHRKNFAIKKPVAVADFK